MQLAVQVGGGWGQHDRSGLEAIVDEAQRAEALGFAAVFVADHYVFENLGRLQPEVPAYELFTVLTTLAQRTRTIRLGSHVACMLFRHPAMHARLFAQVDEASGGRVIAGVGAGWTRAEFAMMGLDFPPIGERLRILDEAVAVMRGLWREERFSFEGRYFRLTDAVCRPKPVQTPGPPLMIGGSGNGIIRRAGTWADIVHMIPTLGAAGTTTPENVRAFDDATIAAKLATLRAAEAAAGRTPGSVRLASTVYTLALTGSAAETRTQIARLAHTFALAPDAVATHPVVLVGTPDEMVAELRRRQAVHGVSLLALNFTSPDQLRTFAEQVLPRLR